MEKECLNCGNIYYKKVNCSKKSWDKSKYCSINCKNNHLHVGEKLEHLKEYQFKKGEHRSINTEFKSENVSGENNAKWKGDDASYTAKHIWIKGQLGKATNCEVCKGNDKKIYHWHNISGNYLRDIKDWINLCPTCHRNVHLNKITL